MTPDLINALFELLGSVMIWANVRQTARDQGYAGLYLPTVVFFALWGVWNLYYYPHLGQWLSFWGGVSIVTANTVWVIQMFYYGRRPSVDKTKGELFP